MLRFWEFGNVFINIFKIPIIVANFIKEETQRVANFGPTEKVKEPLFILLHRTMNYGSKVRRYVINQPQPLEKVWFENFYLQSFSFKTTFKSESLKDFFKSE